MATKHLEYPTVAEIIYQLIDQKVEEEKRYLMIGAGVVLGSQRAYGKQKKEELKLVYAAEEARMIAEEIQGLAEHGYLSGDLEEMIEKTEESEKVKKGMYIFLRKKDLCPENLKGLGGRIEAEFCGPYQRDNFERFREEVAKLLQGTGLEKEKLLDSDYLQELIKQAKEKGAAQKESLRKARALISWQKEMAKRLQEEGSHLETYAREYFNSHY